MEQDETPIKSACNIFDFESPTSHQSLGEDDKMSSPAYVKWDFDLPSVPDKIKHEALELGREINEHKLIRKRKRNRSSPYCSFKSFRLDGVNPLDGTPTRSSSYSRSVNLLKEALGDVPKNDTEEKDIDDTITAKEPKDNFTSDVHDVLFDDSFNDCLNECSQSIETHFYKHNTRLCVDGSVTDETNDSNKCNEIVCSPNSGTGMESSRTGMEELTTNEQTDQTDLTKELDEVDDHLFLEIDLNSLY